MKPKLKIEAKCPSCGAVREVKPEAGRFRMKQHKQGPRYGGLRCDGGYADPVDVAAFAVAARFDAQRMIDGADERRKKAREELKSKLATIDEQVTEASTVVAAYDRLISRIDGSRGRT